MTISDLVKRLQTMLSGSSMLSHVESNAQIRLGKDYNNTDDTFEYFEIQRVGKDVVLVPTDKWERLRK